MAERNCEVLTAPPCPPSPLHCSGEGRGAGNEENKLSLGKEGKKGVLVFVFLFSTICISNYIFILTGNKLS